MGWLKELWTGVPDKQENPKEEKEDGGYVMQYDEPGTGRHKIELDPEQSRKANRQTYGGESWRLW